ncbi:MAG: hypothetical protein CVV27_17035 [Candidatus Melainabacteria bacterium HGW-Melainabacteria-1]|nr:MAG: hypothetical protein CVV27_17035 [Candidatus Melainabacteria bacterium HGW-Melainabacteria-1]
MADSWNAISVTWQAAWLGLNQGYQKLTAPSLAASGCIVLVISGAIPQDNFRMRIMPIAWARLKNDLKVLLFWLNWADRAFSPLSRRPHG